MLKNEIKTLEDDLLKCLECKFENDYTHCIPCKSHLLTISNFGAAIDPHLYSSYLPLTNEISLSLCIYGEKIDSILLKKVNMNA